jgi:hypothetical protein
MFADGARFPYGVLAVPYQIELRDPPEAKTQPSKPTRDCTSVKLIFGYAIHPLLNNQCPARVGSM